MTTKRITREFLNFQREPLEGCSAKPIDEDDLQHWVVTITGPSESPYAGVVFTIDVRYPDDYPHNALRAMFSHPNLEEGCVLNESAARLFLQDIAGFEHKARQFALAHAGQETTLPLMQ
ncbi:hypothetical protein D6D03_05450 [Aureobasidium pullulans]|nr:hypothetical protein D6D03_05450 [Aureobasidium pullulans]